MQFGQDVLSDLPTALGSEWLLANGLGGSASGTAAGWSSRRTHALLTAAGPHGRLTSLLLGVLERVRCEAGAFDLSPAPGGADFPGVGSLESFVADPFPTWRWNFGSARLERTVFVVTGHNAVVVRWRHVEGPALTLTVSPLCAARDPYGRQAQDAATRGAAQGVPGRVRVEIADGAPPLTLWHNGAFLPARVWRTIEHLAEPPGERREEALVPGYVEAGLMPGGALHLVASTEDDLFRSLAREDRLGAPPPKTLAECCALIERHERGERARWTHVALLGADLTAHQASVAHAEGATATVERTTRLSALDGWTVPLAETLLEGLARREHRLTLVASLPGGAERGSATLRAVPALIALRAFEPAREILRGVLEYLDEGLAPERFDLDDGTPRYGDPEPSLWLIHAAELYARRSGDLEFLKHTLYPTLEGVIQFYRAGTHHGIRVEPDGLLASGPGNLKEARPNALWYHALVAMAQLARALGKKESAAFYLAWAREHQQRFHERFWDEGHEALFERLEDDVPVSGLAPAQLLAVSLSPALLAPECASALVATITHELFTPCGLRERPGSNRISPEWLGPFLSARLRVRGRGHEDQAEVTRWLAELRIARRRGVAARLPERFELGGDPPAPAGDPVSILAAAELLRAWIEDVEHATVETPVGAVQ